MEEREHLEEDCWCHPRLLYRLENGVELYVHQYDDGTELPPEIEADAIMTLAQLSEEDLMEN